MNEGLVLRQAYNIFEVKFYDFAWLDITLWHPYIRLYILIAL